MDKVRLSDAEYRYFERVARAIFSNPYADASPALGELIGDVRLPPSVELGEPQVFEHLVNAVEHRLQQVARRGASRAQDVARVHRPVLRYAVLFLAYHRYMQQFDELIAAQRVRPTKPARAPFTGELIARLVRLGFTEAETVRNIEMFYQLRRTYRFVSEALAGVSPVMRRLRHDLWNSVFTADARIYEHYLWDRMEDFSVLLLGATGTGKGAAANALGRAAFIPYDMAAGRFAHGFDGMVTTANLAALPESLMEATLFGHRKGAFTGAVADRTGLFEQCPAHGVLFLDEIGDLSATLQVKLLNVLQDRLYTPVGGSEPRRFGGRVVAATNRSLVEARRQGRFRDDFYYRLCANVIEIPTLRQRLQEAPEELSVLVRSVLRRMLGPVGVELQDDVLASLRRSLPADYHWPGNVRELEQAVRRILLGNTYTGDPTARSSSPTVDDGFLRRVADGRMDAQTLVSQYCARLHERTGSYAAVARITGLDRRTVRRQVELAHAQSGSSSDDLGVYTDCTHRK